MVGSTYAPQRWDEVDVSKVQPDVVGTSATATAGQTTNIDLQLADDILIRAVDFGCKNQAFGDYLDIYVIDKDGVYVPANTVLSHPVDNYYIISDSQQQKGYEAIAPFKALGGLYLRISYTSTGLFNVNILLNLMAIKVLI